MYCMQKIIGRTGTSRLAFLEREFPNCRVCGSSCHSGALGPLDILISTYLVSYRAHSTS
jgi:hypothetical protein